MYIEKMASKFRIHLLRAGINTDEQLVQMSYHDLMKIRHVGHAAIEEVNQKVRIPMGLEPLVRTEPQTIHPNCKAGIDKYWARYRRGEVTTNKYHRVKA